MVRLRGRLRTIRGDVSRYRARKQETEYWSLKEKIAKQKRAIARAKMQKQLRDLKIQERRLKGSRIGPGMKKDLKRLMRQFG